MRGVWQMRQPSALSFSFSLIWPPLPSQEEVELPCLLSPTIPHRGWRRTARGPGPVPPEPPQSARCQLQLQRFLRDWDEGGEGGEGGTPTPPSGVNELRLTSSLVQIRQRLVNLTPSCWQTETMLKDTGQILGCHTFSDQASCFLTVNYDSEEKYLWTSFNYIVSVKDEKVLLIFIVWEKCSRLCI